MSSTTDDSRVTIRWAAFSLAVSVVLVAIKGSAWLLTGSTAILSDALESVVNIVTSFVALYAVWLSLQPRDPEHPYGHGKVEYLSAGIEGALVAFAGLSILAIALYHLVNPPQLQDLGVGALVSAGAGAIAAVTGTLLVHAGRRHQSPTLEADGVHIRSDAVTSLGAVAGVLLTLLTGIPAFDALTAGLLALWLIREGVGVMRQALGGLMDEASPELLDEIAEVLESVREPGWISPHHTKVHRLGQTIHIDLHLVFPRYWSIEKTHAATVTMEEAIQARFGERAELMVHMEACTPQGCTYCDMPQCPVRDADFVRRRTWTGALIRQPFRGAPLSHEPDVPRDG